jgi:hypothetical protein
LEFQTFFLSSFNKKAGMGLEGRPILEVAGGFLFNLIDATWINEERQDALAAPGSGDLSVTK